MRSPSTSLSYHLTNAAISTCSTSDQRIPSFYLLAAIAIVTTTASASLSSSVCHCPYCTTSSTSHMLCNYAYRKRLARSQNFLSNLNVKNSIRICSIRVMYMNDCRSFKLFSKLLTQFLFSSFPASENIIANVTQSTSPSPIDSKVSGQSHDISATVSLTPSPGLPLPTSTTAVAEINSQVDFVPSTSSTYLSQDASSSISESLTFSQ